MGTGLNFLLTAEQALLSQATLEYWALEHTIISPSTFSALELSTIIQSASLLNAFEDVLFNLTTASINQLHSFSLASSIHLHVLKGDATHLDIPVEHYDAVYQDAFSPDVNPELWSPLFFQRIYNTMHTGGCLTTFSVRRLVRDHLSAAGFIVQKKPGPPGGKREMLLAIKPDHDRTTE